MISLDTIENEIIELEKKDTTFAVVERLAWLYIVKDHIKPQEGKKITGKMTGSEFADACSGVPCDLLVGVLSEHMEVIKALYPREYAAVIEKIKNLY